MAVTSAVAGELLGGTGLVDSAASMLGGGKAAEKVAEIALDTVLVDIPTDTIPEMIVNANAGMSTGEVLEQAGLNVLINTAINIGADYVLPEVAGAVIKAVDESGATKVVGDGLEDVLKTSDTGFKMADDVSDASKALDMSDAIKIAEDGSDVSKAVENAATADKGVIQTTDLAKTADAGKAIEHAADTSKATGKIDDVAKGASNVTDAEKATSKVADATKAAGNTADSGKTLEHVADSGKTTEHIANSEKTADHATDVKKTADQATDTENEACHSTDTSNNANYDIDSTKVAEDEHEVVVDSHYNLTHKDGLKEIPGEANHTNQNAVYRDIVPRSQGSCVKLEGDVFKDKGSQHYKLHESLEKWWNQYRVGGEKFGKNPTDYEYSIAAEQAYIDAGLKPVDAQYAVQCSKEQLAQWRLLREHEATLGRTLSSKEQKDFFENISKTIEESGGMSYVDNILKQNEVPRIPNEMKIFRKAE